MTRIFPLILLVFGLYLSAAAQTITHAWDFNSSVVNNQVDGWNIVNFTNANTANGILSLTGSARFNHIRYNVPSGVTINPSQSKTAIIRLKNETSETVGRLYFWGSQASAVFIDFDITPNDSQFREYKIDLSRDTAWTGTISAIRFDVPTTLQTAYYGQQVKVDYVKLSTEVLPPPAPLPKPTMPAREPAPFGINLAGAGFGEKQNMPGVYMQHYEYPTKAELDYWKAKGLNLVRFSFVWERIQKSLNGPLDNFELTQMKRFVDEARARGMWVLLDFHNYGRRVINGNEVILGASGLPVATVTDVWRKLALVFKDYDNIWGYGIMNEPHDMLPTHPWFEIAQDLIEEIRDVDTHTPIVVGGDRWSSGYHWPSYSDNLKNLYDPSNKLIFEAHQYFDANFSGLYANSYDADQVTPTTGVDRIAPFVNWLKQNNLKGFVGEYSIPDDAADLSRWRVTLDNMLAYMKANGVNGTYWAAGPRWGANRMAVEPLGGVDRPQMTVLQNYLTADVVPTGSPTNQTHVWDFNGSLTNGLVDNWSFVQYGSVSAANGILSLTVSQTYNHMKHQPTAANAINPAVSKYAVIRLKNETPDTKARFYWRGADLAAHFVEFTITANDTQFKEYVVNLTQNTNWSGQSTIKEIRFDLPSPSSASAIGKIVRVDQVKLLSAVAPAPQPLTWNFDAPVTNNMVENWVIVNYTNASTANGILNLIAPVTYNHIKLDVPAASPIDPAVYQYATIKLKNGTAETKARFYWRGPDLAAHYAEFTITANDATFKEYTVDLSQIAAWAGQGTIKQIRFDVPTPVQAASWGAPVAIDFISLAATASPMQTLNVSSVSQLLVAEGGLLKDQRQWQVVSAKDGVFQVMATVPQEERGQLFISDLSGRKLYSKLHTLPKGTTVLEAKVKRMAAGIYVVTWYNGREKITQKVKVN
ncbi:glycoside hydrolase family 5 protein [Rufibacter ruber]|uniref:glycoside hydrolase family 5 protein n=1 Tax=Rufibacter ruber TaxID=1783499 RepID=UPI0009EED8BB|nr:glycoside hydrolase family 5 protein [Rufibacter ruber]